MAPRREAGWRLQSPGAARVAALAISVITGAVVSLAGGGIGLAAARSHPGMPASGHRMALIQAAARESRVPVRLLLAISYNQSRWERQGDAPSVDGGYGLMDLTGRTFPADDGGTGLSRPTPRDMIPARAHDPLDQAARLLHVSVRTVKDTEWGNVRGAAAVLARYARRLGGGVLPASLGGWYGAVAEYSGATSAPTARQFADDVYATLRKGASLTTTDGQVMDLPPSPGLRPARAQLARLGLRPAVTPPSAAVDCPPVLHCSFVPAAYAQDSSDPGNYGNYDQAARPDHMLNPAGQPASMKIDYIIVHDTEGSYDAAISTFQNPASYVSANYVIRSSDGAVTEMVRPQDVSWAAADWYVNMHAINIENEGFAAQGSTWYTGAMYRSLATLVRYLAARYGIPLDREHILGHEDAPGPTSYGTSVQHWDPGPFWNWNHFMALVHGVSDSAEQAGGGSASRGTHHLVTIDPTFADNEPKVTNCPGRRCVTLPQQPANFVYLRTGPGGSYPLVGDPILHPGGGNGTTVDSDWGDKATIERDIRLRRAERRLDGYLVLRPEGVVLQSIRTRATGTVYKRRGGDAETGDDVDPGVRCRLSRDIGLPRGGARADSGQAVLHHSRWPGVPHDRHSSHGLLLRRDNRLQPAGRSHRHHRQDGL